VLWNQSWAL